MAKKIVRLTESQLSKLIKKVIKEQTLLKEGACPVLEKYPGDIKDGSYKEAEFEGNDPRCQKLYVNGQGYDVDGEFYSSESCSRGGKYKRLPSGVYKGTFTKRNDCYWFNTNGQNFLI